MSHNNTTCRLECFDDGFRLAIAGREPAIVEWPLVRQIVAYRKDPGGADLLCLGFRIDNISNNYIEVHEEMDGYADLLEAMYDALPEIRREWWQEITDTFGPNRTTIYGLPLAEQGQSTPAERYLIRHIQRRKQTRRTWQRWSLVGAVLLTATWAQATLTGWLGGYHRPLAAVLPLAWAVLAAKLAATPKGFFALLAGFCLLEWGWSGLAKSGGASLVGLLGTGEFSCLLLLGLEILLGMGMMIFFHRKSGG